MAIAAFLILAVAAVIAAVMVISFRSPVSSALALVATLAIMAALFAIIGATFIAALQVIVYAGAIMVLFLFVIMLLNLKKDEWGPDKKKVHRVVGIILAGALLVQIGIFLMAGIAQVRQVPGAGEKILPVEGIAMRLFTDYLYPFEITSLLLLAAIVGAVVLARRKGD